MDVNSLDAFCRLMIMTRAQKEADQYVDERCRIKNIPRPLYPQCFSDPELLHSYVLGLVAGALNEYHRQCTGTTYLRNAGKGGTGGGKCGKGPILGGFAAGRPRYKGGMSQLF